MVSADSLGMLKKLRPMYVPDEDGTLHSRGLMSRPYPIKVRGTLTPQLTINGVGGVSTVHDCTCMCFHERSDRSKRWSECPARLWYTKQEQAWH